MISQYRQGLIALMVVMVFNGVMAQGLKSLARAITGKSEEKPVVTTPSKPQPVKRTSVTKPKPDTKANVRPLTRAVDEPIASNIVPRVEAEPAATPPTIIDRVESLEQRANATLTTMKEAEVRAESLQVALNDALKQIGILQAPKTEILPSIKVGFLAQFQGQATREQSTALQESNPNFIRHWQRQLYVRRLRVLVGGNVSKNTSVFFESDATNIGRVGNNGTKTSTVQMYVQDAQLQHVFSPEFSVIAGLQLVGISRNGLQGAASLMALNYGTYQFAASGPLDNNVGRDLGVNARGFLFDERFEYRLGIFSGRSINQYSPFRGTMRLNYALLDKEKGLFYSGTTLGKGNILSIGAGADMQGTYRGYSLDAFADLPATEVGSVTASAGVMFLDGGGSDTDSTYFTGLVPRQRILFSELGFFFKDIALQPYVKYESQSVQANILKQVNAKPNTLALNNRLRSSSRLGFGINYFLNGHGANLKLLHEFIYYNRAAIDPTQPESASTSELTLQFQYFTF